MKCVALALSLFLFLGGCVVLADKADYADYRAVRLSREREARLHAMLRYIERHPEGEWADEIRGERAHHDLPTFEAGKASREGLESYLALFPDGEFAEQARSRLSAIALLEQRKREESERASALSAERRAHEDELRRTWLTRFVAHWSKTLFTLSGWGEPIPEVARQNPSFSRAFGAQPKPRCTHDECLKYYESRYAIPVPGGTRIERSVQLALRLRMQEGRLVRAELLMEGRGFSRWYELENRKLVVDGDPESRDAAVQWASERILPLLRELGSEPVPAVDYLLPPIERPAIAATGELTDTSVEGPSSPPNRLTGGRSPEAQEAANEDDTARLLQPEAPADMVFAPVQIDREGRVRASEEPAVVQPPPGAGASEQEGAMVMEPLPPAMPATTRAFLVGGLRIVIFAASGDEAGPAYDALVIEPIRPVSEAASRTPSDPPGRSDPRQKRH